MAGAFAVAASGYVLMRLAEADSGIWPALLACTPIAAGLVAVATLVTEYAIGVAPPERAGSVSALVETSGELGGALGMAVLGSILGAVYTSRVVELLPAGLSDKVIGASSETLGEATVVAAQLGGDQGRSVLEAARTAYVDAMHVTDLAAAALLLVGAVLALTMLPRRTSPAPAEATYEAAPTGR
jgi:DHA2 family multidrug resistance protein-like MFS transporter